MLPRTAFVPRVPRHADCDRRHSWTHSPKSPTRRSPRRRGPTSHKRRLWWEEEEDESCRLFVVMVAIPAIARVWSARVVPSIRVSTTQTKKKLLIRMIRAVVVVVVAHKVTNFSNPSIPKPIPRGPIAANCHHRTWSWVWQTIAAAAAAAAATESTASRGEGSVARFDRREGPRSGWRASSSPIMTTTTEGRGDAASSAPEREAYLFESDDDAMARDCYW